MSAGTLTLTTNSDAVTGSGTNFTTELVSGDFAVVVVGGITYTLPVKSVDSATKLTLVSKYPGPSQNGLAWSAVPRATQNLITAAVVAQATEALRGLNYDKQNWQQVFSGTGTITVKLPDGSTYSGPAWNGMTSLLAGKMDKSQNLNDVPDKAAARTNIGLGEGSSLKVGQVTVETAGYSTLTARNTSRTSTDLGAQVMLEVSPAVGSKPYLTQRYNDGSNTNQILNNLPTSSGVIAVQGTSGLMYKRDISPAPLSDAVERIAALEMVHFTYKDDEQNRVRFGIIAEQAETIAPQYIKHNLEPDPNAIYDADELDEAGRPLLPVMRDRPSVDNNPIVMDLLGAVQYLLREVAELKESRT
ncbi:tail fiber domain-containing protein [Leclercia sp. UBA7405]|uniref:tail fiber domain-containing protein n=1 Tax=Leclercia sp. UBA7405 TaxID=1946743 RepID=UPI00301B38AB